MTTAYLEILAGGRAYTLDLKSGEFFREPGERIRLSSQQWRLLKHFAEHPNQLFSKEQLCQSHWAGAAIGPEAIDQAIRTLRQALGDGDRSILITDRARGYRLAAEVRSVSPEEPTNVLSPLRTSGVSSAGFNEPRVADHRDNPKPFQVGPTALTSVFRMLSDTTDGLDLSFRYTHDLRKPPADIAVAYRRLARLAEQQAQEGGYPHFNGPNTRLIRCSEENTRQLPDGRERKGIVVELGPVSWEQHTVYNCFLDQALPEFDGETIRNKFANEQRLYSEGADLRWCELSNVLTVNVVLISRDGYGLVQRRSKRGVSAAARKLTGGVCENIHRFKDEADPINPLKRLNPLGGSSGRLIDYAYKPTGIPSPLLTAQRGVFEEVSPELYYEHIEGRAASMVVLGIMFDLQTFNPHVSGVIPLECSHDEIHAYPRKHAGTDDSEAEEFLMLPLDVSNPLTKKYLSEPLDWVPAGLATFGLAIQYWQERQRHRQAK